MHKVIIVDDELLIRTHLKTLIDWDANGFSLCGEASNGLEALKLIEREHPDIIISDVRMPFMDGLDLSLEVKGKYPSSKMIILSNYDDYEYVRNALKNGVIDYILKHNLNEMTLLESLSNVKATLLKNNQNSSVAKTPSPIDLTALKERFVLNLLTRLYSYNDEIDAHLKTLDIKLDLVNALAIIMVIDDYKVGIANRSLIDTSLLEFSILNISEEILLDSRNGIISHIENEKYVILLSFANTKSSAMVESSITSVLDRIKSCLKKFMNVSVSFSIGSQCIHLKDIYLSYENAEKRLLELFYLGKNSIIKNTHKKKTNSLLTGLSIELEKKIVCSIKMQDTKALNATLESIFKNIHTEKLSYASSHMIFSDLLGIVSKFCKENSIDSFFINPDGLSPNEKLASFDTVNEIRIWLLKLFEKLMFTLTLDYNKQYSEYIKKTINYIRKSYAEDISLGSAAEEININNQYLSKLFKDEVGIGFSEYLSDFRINLAKVLLEDSKHEIKDIITMCGFNNYNYFFNIFKKKTGLTPKEYISKQK